MNEALVLFFTGEFDRWRTFRKTKNSEKRSIKLAQSILAANPLLDEFDSALWCVMRGVKNGGESVLNQELEILSALGKMTVKVVRDSKEFQTNKSFPRGYEATLWAIWFVAQQSYRYWDLKDSQDKVKKSAEDAVRSEIAKAGGNARRDKQKPLREKIERLAYKGLTKSKRQRYGIWTKYEDMEWDLWGKLTAAEQDQVRPSTIGQWVKETFPELTTKRVKKKK